MHYSQKTVALAIVIFFTTFVGQTTAQNCAIPHIVTLETDNKTKTECASPGVTLAKLSTKYIQSILKITQTPEDYLDIKLINDTIIIEVNNSLCPHPYSFEADNAEFKTYIDETWKESVEIYVEFNCTDGRSKEVTFEIPIYDENTQSPKFNLDFYNLTIEPCSNGTNQGACPLNFENPIYVIDNDRHVSNAYMNFTVSNDFLHENLLAITWSDLELTYEEKDVRPTGHRTNVHLYLKPSDLFNIGETIEFELVALNTQPFPSSNIKPYGKTIININFGELPPIEPPVLLKPPLFSSSVYYVTINSLQEGLEGSELKNIQPSPVSSYYVGINNDTSQMGITYDMESDIFAIDPYSGTIWYKEDLTMESFERFNKVEVYQIKAVLQQFDFLDSSVPLVVYFDLKDENSSETPPDNCYSTTTPPEGNTTCPQGSCPTSEPWPGTSTTEGGDNETTSQSTTEETTDPTTISTTVTDPTGTPIITSEPSSTTIDTSDPTSSTTETSEPISTSPTPTSEPGSTTETSEETTETFEPSPTSPLPSTETPSTPDLSTVNPTTEVPEITTPSSTTEATTTKDPEITTPSSTTETPTTKDPDITTPSSTTEAPTTEDPEITTPSSTTEAPTTEDPEITTPSSTTEAPTTYPTTTPGVTTENPMTSTPDYGGCCGSCGIVTNFTCPSGDNPDVMYQDPLDCTVFHQCAHDGHGGIIDRVQSCADNTIFCPTKQQCAYECDCTAVYPRSILLQSCEDVICCGDDDKCINSTSPQNICHSEGQIADPIYCDVFHDCRPETEHSLTKFIDCPMECPLGLVWCDKQKVCLWPEECPCEGGRLPSKCSVCGGPQQTTAPHMKFKNYMHVYFDHLV